MAKIATNTLVCVEWVDAAFDLDEEQHTTALKTVGWLVKANRKVVVVAGETDEGYKYQRSFTTIPRSLIVSIRLLRYQDDPPSAD